MKDRMTTILNLMTASSHAAVEKAKAEGGIAPGITGFAESGDDAFFLHTRFSDFGHRTRLTFESSAGNDLIWIRLTHLFGYLDFSEGADPNQLVGLLRENAEAAAYLAIGVIDKVPYVTLNNHGSYLATWSDEDIAKALLDQLSRIIINLLFGLQFLVGELGVNQVRP